MVLFTMPRVARAQGLIVNKTIDERKDFNRSAFGAASLIKNICIPETKNILNRLTLNIMRMTSGFVYGFTCVSCRGL